MLRLLCITAHPDDEAAGFGGTLLHYAERGVETHVICLTPGQAATHRGGAKSDQELSAVRRLEFQAACKVLKISHGTVLDYPDGKLDRQDFHAVVENLTRRVRQIRPQVIMTMGTEGAVSAHPDHSMVTVFGTLAAHWASRTNRFPEQLQNGLTPHQTQKLYYSTALFTMPERQPVALAPVTTTIQLEQREVEAKITAFKCHTSQQPLFGYFETIVRNRGNAEFFHLANSSTPRKAEIETDLFAEVKE
ncbi:MAG TPA: PIG-L family deacetylase [Candidatus Angelobacter sp.]|jgi:LmbE family N-acetylglucosaminyl deacetylase